MIEIPESLNIAAELKRVVVGKRIVEVETEHTKHGFAWYTGTKEAYRHDMEGKQIKNVTGLGSIIEFNLGQFMFTINDGVNLRYYEAGEKLPSRYQMRMVLEDGAILVCTVQMYGGMMLFRPEEYDNIYYLTAKVKPQPMTEDFTYAYFQGLREGVGGNLSAKGFLATEQRIPGLGNGVLQDILLEAGIHPKKKIGTLREADWKRMYHALVETLEEMTVKGGRDTEKDLYGKSGGYSTKLSKKTVGSNCPYCGNQIQKATYLGGSIYFCPCCQEC